MLRLVCLSILLFSLSCKSQNRSPNGLSIDDISKYNWIAKLAPGFYSDLSIAVKDSLITGVYEYYDGWDARYKSFVQSSQCYFVGVLKAGSNTVLVKAGWPFNESTHGVIKLSNSTSLCLSLNDQPVGYGAVDFVDTGYCSQLNSAKEWVQIRIVKSKKAALYSTPDSSSRKKGYLVNEDIVRVSSINGNWLNIEYYDLTNRNNVKSYWVREEDLYGIYEIFK